LDNKLTFSIFLAIFGFLVSFFISLIAGSSFVGILLKSLISSLVLGGLGYLLIYLLDKYGNESTQNQRRDSKLDGRSFNRKINEMNNNFSNENLYNKDIIQDNFRKATDQEFNQEFPKADSSENQVDITEDKISYEEIFSKLDNDEKEMDKEVKVEKSKSNLKNNEEFNKSVIDELKSEKQKETIEVNISDSSIIVDGDSELNPSYISAEDAAKISATSKIDSISGEIKNIDDKFIYFSKGPKIENKPEKIAKVIKEMLKNE